MLLENENKEQTSFVHDCTSQTRLVNHHQTQQTKRRSNYSLISFPYFLTDFAYAHPGINPFMLNAGWLDAAYMNYAWTDYFRHQHQPHHPALAKGKYWEILHMQITLALPDSDFPPEHHHAQLFWSMKLSRVKKYMKFPFSMLLIRPACIAVEFKLKIFSRPSRAVCVCGFGRFATLFSIKNNDSWNR